MSGINKSKTGWLKDPTKARPGETIGGGFFIFRRGDGSNRIRPSQWPFEYASINEALDQARKLAAANPGYRFDIVQVAHSVVFAAEHDDYSPSDPAGPGYSGGDDAARVRGYIGSEVT